jgi:hypothetical protein
MESVTVVLPRPRSSAAVTTPSLALRHTVSMTSGAETPLRALADAPSSAHISCNPCDEAIVRHLLGHVGRIDCELRVDAGVAAGVLAISVRLAVAS